MADSLSGKGSSEMFAEGEMWASRPWRSERESMLRRRFWRERGQEAEQRGGGRKLAVPVFFWLPVALANARRALVLAARCASGCVFLSSSASERS